MNVPSTVTKAVDDVMPLDLSISRNSSQNLAGDSGVLDLSTCSESSSPVPTNDSSSVSGSDYSLEDEEEINVWD
jgi:hypothetical protein